MTSFVLDSDEPVQNAHPNEHFALENNYTAIQPQNSNIRPQEYVGKRSISYQSSDE